MSRAILAAVLLFITSPIAAPVLAQKGGDSLVTVTATGVGAVLKIPARWHVIQEDTKDSAAVFIYHIRNPATDSNSDDRTNVVVIIARARMSADFKSFTDTLMGGQFDKSTTILGDTMWSADRRTIYWRAQRKDVPYAGYDHLSKNGSRWVHVRFVMPLVKETPPAWTEETLFEVNAMMESIRVSGERMFGPESKSSAGGHPPPS